MRLRSKLIVFIVSLVIFSLSLFVLIRSLTIERAHEEQKAIFTGKVIARVRGVLEGEYDRIATLCQDWAVWDAMYQFAAAPTPEFRDDSLPPTILNESRLDLLLVLDRQMGFVHRQGRIGANGKEDDFGLRLRPENRLWSVLREHFPARGLRRSLCVTPSGPLLLVSMPILETDGRGPANGRLVMGRLIGPDFAPVLSRALQERTELWFPRGGTQAVWRCMRGQFGARSFHFHETDSALTICHLVRDCRGEDAFIVRVQADKNIFFILERSTGIFFLLLLGGVLLTALAFYLFVQRQMVRRLKGVSDHLDRVDDVNDLTLPVDQASRDEIAQLIRHINGMQARLKAGISRERTMEMAMLRNENLVLTGRLAANVAHEVNNPLFSISNALQVIRQEVAGGAGADVREVIELAEREIRRVRTITRNLYDFTRINLERFTAVDLGAVISQAIRVLQLGQGMGRTQIRITGVTGPLKVSGNADSLQQVFMNLLLNASEAMGGGGQVTIEVQPGPEEWIVAIADQGPGFAPEVRERLFEPFNSSKDVKGVGLGLYISYQVVVRHNGTMRLLDDGKPGARLLIRLPRDKGEPHG